MELQRKQDTSVTTYIENLLSGTPFIKIISEYKDDVLDVPSIAIKTGNTTGEDFELGNKNVLLVRTYFIDIFALNITQRNDYAYKIFNELTKNPIPVYNYDEGFVDPSRLGTLKFLRGRIQPIDIIQELVDKMHYRSQVTYIAVYDEHD